MLSRARQLAPGLKKFCAHHRSRLLVSTTVNPAEVSKFGKVGAEWWNAGSTHGTGPLHAMNPVRVSFIRSRLAQELGRAHLPAHEQLRGVEILDVGCGGGLLSESLSRLGAKVVAIDPSPENVAVAQSHSKIDPLTRSTEYVCGTIESISDKYPGKFDAVCSLEVLEHVDNPPSFVSACSACVRPGGSLFFSTINRTAKSYLMTIVGAEYLFRLLPVGTHDWKKYVTPEELIAMVSSAANGSDGMGVSKLDVQGLVLSPGMPLPSWALSSSDHDVNYIAHFALRAPK